MIDLKTGIRITKTVSLKDLEFLSLYRRNWVGENPYSRVFSAVIILAILTMLVITKTVWKNYDKDLSSVMWWLIYSP